jgi:hypothetical protein
VSETSLPHGFQYSSAGHQAANRDLRHVAVPRDRGAVLRRDLPELDLLPPLESWQVSMRALKRLSSPSAPINTVILLTSSLVYSAGLAFIELGNRRRLIQCCVITWALGFVVSDPQIRVRVL